MAEEHSDTVNKLSDINSEITKILDKYDKEKTDRMSSDDDMALSKLIERAEQQPVTRDILKVWCCASPRHSRLAALPRLLTVSHSIKELIMMSE